jgi:LuxR family maltose regulon positive regulatory protein
MPRINMHISRPGVSTQIQRLVDGAREATGDRNWSLQSTADMLEAWLLLWQGRAAEMEAALQRIEEDTHWLGQPAGLRIRLLSLNAMYQVICDDKEAVRATCDAIVAQAASLRQCGDLSVTFLAIAVRNSAVIGDWPTVRRYLPELQADAGKENPCMQMFIRALEAHLAFQEGRVAEARATLRELAKTSAMLDTNCLDAMVRTRLALAELADASPTAAWQALEPLIERIETSGNVGQTLVMGTESLTQLSLAPWDGAASRKGLAALHRWIEVARSFKAGAQEGPRVSSAQQDAGLSARELQVLALLTQGQSNKLIARALDLSPHTVKRHVARILDRLDLASRMQAADWYRTRFES